MASWCEALSFGFACVRWSDVQTIHVSFCMTRFSPLFSASSCLGRSQWPCSVSHERQRLEANPLVSAAHAALPIQATFLACIRSCGGTSVRMLFYPQACMEVAPTGRETYSRTGTNTCGDLQHYIRLQHCKPLPGRDKETRPEQSKHCNIVATAY